MLQKVLELFNSSTISGALALKETIGTIQEIIGCLRSNGADLEAQVCTLLDNAMRDFALEFKLEYDDKWLWKVLEEKGDILKGLDETLYDKKLLQYVFNKKDISAEESDEWKHLIRVQLSKEEMNEVRHFLEYKKEGPEDKQPKLYTLAAPLPPEKEYIEREQEEEILALLRNKKKLVLVNGLGGVGKSAVCKRIFQNLYAKGKVRLGWVTYNGKNLERDFVAQFRYPKEKRKGELTYFLQAEIDPNAIIFVDNFNVIEREDSYIQKLASARCNVICTSRITDFAYFETVPINVFEVEKCIALFKRYARIDAENIIYDDTIAAIAKCVGRHTLTLEVLGKICWAEEKNPAIVLNELKEKGIDVSGEAEVELQECTLVEHLMRIFPIDRLSEEQKYILYHFAICPFEHTPEEMLDWIDIRKRAVVKLLERYGWFVYERENHTYYMHPIIRAVVAKVCEPEKGWFDKLVHNLATVTRYDRAQGSARREFYGSYLNKVIELTKKWGIVSLDAAQLYFNLAILELFKRNYEEAIKLLKEELGLWDKIRAEGLEKEVFINTKVANIKVQIGVNYYYLDRGEDALEWYGQVKQMKGTYADKELEEQLGNNCGLVYQKQAEELMAKGKNADMLLEKAVSGYESTINAYLKMGKRDLNVAIGYRNLADCKYKMKHYQEAAEAFERAIDIAEKAIKDKENNPDLERIYGQLAYTYDAWGDSLSEKSEKKAKYEKALRYYEKCHESCNVNYYKGISWIELDELEEKWNLCREKMTR